MFKYIWYFIWHFIWYIFWHFNWHIIWCFIWYIFWHSIWPLRSNGAYWEVEVQQCSLSSAGPRLRSSGAHCARTVLGWDPMVLTELDRSQVEIILHNRHSISYNLASLYIIVSWQAPDSGKIAKYIRTRPLARTQLSFLKDVSQNCIELLRFCSCQLRKLRKSRRTPSFLTLSRSKLRNLPESLRFWCQVIKLADRQIDR